MFHHFEDDKWEAWLIGQVVVKDTALWDSYVAGVVASLKHIKAKTAFRGDKVAQFAGTAKSTGLVIIMFCNVEEAKGWFHSTDYQKLIPLRDLAADVNIALYSK